MFKKFLALMFCGVLMAQVNAEDKSSEDAQSALNYKMKSLEGKEVELQKFKGKVLVVVNVASACGLTPQYKTLQALHEKYEDKGLAVLGFPCNQFGKQEPGSASEIAAFYESKYKVTFPMFDKIEVNGEGAADFYKHLTAVDAKPKGNGKVTWNFEKFVIGRSGEVVARFSPQTAPDDAEFLATIEKELNSK
jgi:glutathione peroxidase